jgi:hypothetical protein
MASRRAISSALRTASRIRAASPSPCPRAPLHRPSPAGFLFNRAAAYASSAETQPVRARPQRKSMVVVYGWSQHIDLSLITSLQNVDSAHHARHDIAIVDTNFVNSIFLVYSYHLRLRRKIFSSIRYLRYWMMHASRQIFLSVQKKR